MTKELILEDLNQIFINVLKDKSIKLTYEKTAGDIEDWDSLNHIKLIVAIENHFNIEFSAEEIREINSIGKICEIVSEKIK
jgi:acyl carrier protein